MAALPGVRSEVIVQPSDVLCQHLLSGRIDFAIGRMPEGPDAGLLDCRTIAAEPVTLMVRRGHPLDRAGPVKPDDLMAHDWVMPGPEAVLTRAVQARLRALGLPQPPQRVATASFLLTLALVQQSNAIAPIARAVGEAFARGPEAAYVELRVDLGIEVEPFGLITRARMELPPAARRLADLILAAQPSSMRSALAAKSERA
jgi:DNA-binding transcriptional LysR family regulator